MPNEARAEPPARGDWAERLVARRWWSRGMGARRARPAPPRWGRRARARRDRPDPRQRVRRGGGGARHALRVAVRAERPARGDRRPVPGHGRGSSAAPDASSAACARRPGSAGPTPTSTAPTPASSAGSTGTYVVVGLEDLPPERVLPGCARRPPSLAARLRREFPALRLALDGRGCPQPRPAPGQHPGGPPGGGPRPAPVPRPAPAGLRRGGGGRAPRPERRPRHRPRDGARGRPCPRPAAVDHSAERRVDARPGPGHRLRPAHGQPLPRGAAAGAPRVRGRGRGGRQAGGTVALSGASVALGFLALLLVPLAEIRSVAIGGLAVTALSVAVAATLLPAVLAVLGARVDAGRLPRLVPARSPGGRGRGGRPSSARGPSP